MLTSQHVTIRPNKISPHVIAACTGSFCLRDEPQGVTLTHPSRVRTATRDRLCRKTLQKDSAYPLHEGRRACGGVLRRQTWFQAQTWLGHRRRTRLGGGATHPQQLRSLVVGAGCGEIPPEEGDEREEPRSRFPWCWCAPILPGSQPQPHTRTHKI